jgi:hypothetical protein
MTMMALLFFILLLAVLAAWQGARKPSISLFIVDFILGVSWFLHHMTDVIGLSL